MSREFADASRRYDACGKRVGSERIDFVLHAIRITFVMQCDYDYTRVVTYYSYPFIIPEWSDSKR